MIENNKKNFDPTNSFTFFGSWDNSIKDLEKVSIGTAYRLYRAIADYSMYDEVPNFEDNPFLTAIWRTIEVEIDHSVKRRKRNFDKDTINEDYQKIINAVVNYPNKSLREIADITGTSKDMVTRVKRKYNREIQDRLNKADKCADGISDNSSDIVSYTDIVSDNNSDTVSYTDIDNNTDTMRQDSATADIFPKIGNNSVLENNNTAQKRGQMEKEYTHKGITGRYTNIYNGVDEGEIETEDLPF